MAVVFALPKLAWLREHAPDAFRSAAFFLFPKDTPFLFPKDTPVAKLTGQIGANPTDAGNSLLLNNLRRAWNMNAARAVGLERLLPQLRESASVAEKLLLLPTFTLCDHPTNTRSDQP